MFSLLLDYAGPGMRSQMHDEFMDQLNEPLPSDEIGLEEQRATWGENAALDASVFGPVMGISG